jgi:hypothetical protein
MDQDHEQERLPLPSEDTGDLVDEPASGMTDDYLVAREEGLPYAPPTERVPNEASASETDADELERSDAIQLTDAEPPRDDELRARVLEALRASDVPAGDRIRVAVSGSMVVVQGEVESIDVLDEVVGIVGDVPGVSDVLDEVEVAGI